MPAMSPGRLDADVDGYRQAGAANTPPPAIPSDPLAGGLTPIEQLVRVLGLAANLGDEQDNLDNVTDHAERDLLTGEAATAFEAQDRDATAELRGAAGQDPSAQLAQQIPQLAAGMAGSLAGALGSAMQQFGQIPQQMAQGAQQAVQTGMGMLQSGSSYTGLEGAADPLDSLDTLDPMTEDLADFDAVDGDLAGSGSFGGGSGGSAPGTGAGGGAAPAVPLGPAAPPSAGTFLSSTRSAAAAPHAAPGPTPTAGGGMAGGPMVPPAAMNGAGGADKDGKTETKRISVPPVRNGAPVQGRITTPAADLAVARTVRGKPVATRRIMVPRDHDPQAADAAERR